LLFAYAAIAAYNLCCGRGVNTTDLSAGVFRIGLGLALGVLFCWGWLAEPFERQSASSHSVRIGLRQFDAKTRIRSISW